MTIMQAIAGEIEPYSLSDDALEKALIDSNGRFGDGGMIDIEDDYDFGLKKVVGYAAMLCLNRLRVLASENIGGISQSFSVAKLEKRIEAIASDCGLSADLLLADGDSPTITYMSLM